MCPLKLAKNPRISQAQSLEEDRFATLPVGTFLSTQLDCGNVRLRRWAYLWVQCAGKLDILQPGLCSHSDIALSGLLPLRGLRPLRAEDNDREKPTSSPSSFLHELVHDDSDMLRFLAGNQRKARVLFPNA